MVDVTPLASKMRAKAAELMTGLYDVPALSQAGELTRLANELNQAAAGYYGDPQTVDVRRFMGCYARARIAWCNASGEALV